ncbi:MAG: hypothetical protein DRP74_01825 [Candidatus Omnitrophota bacterium]|nr:MAG: hypothetical protein DRP74_01825 [Candidatus Omnitrophota bacterium]
MEKRKIMVVNDELTFLQMMKLNLEETEKYEVLTLAGAKDILAHVEKFRPDVILLDLVMPTIGGLEACEMLNNHPIGKNTPIIVLTALDKDIDKLKAYKKGVVDYLVKPVETEKVVATIEKVLRQD